jgi:hypothetical protein
MRRFERRIRARRLAELIAGEVIGGVLGAGALVVLVDGVADPDGTPDPRLGRAELIL